MKTKTKGRKPAEFKKFEEFTRKLVSVPKEEINRREKEAKERDSDKVKSHK